MKTIIHVAQDAIRKNMKHGTNDPAIIVRNYKGSTRHHEVKLAEGIVIKHDQSNPLSCGARVWIECDSDRIDVV